jgi:uncharacterized tellurite resistance protein B-like protein
MKFDKSMSGYHMLFILSEVDGNFDAAEKKVVEQYIKENHPSLIDLEEQNRTLNALPKELYMEHFEKVANDFYWQSTPEERNNFVNFAFKLVKADHKISKEENIYIDALYNFWDLSVD